MLKQQIMQVKREFWEHKGVIFKFPLGVAIVFLVSLLASLTYKVINMDEVNFSFKGFPMSVSTTSQERIMNNAQWQFDSSLEVDKKSMSAIDTEFFNKKSNDSSFYINEVQVEGETATAGTTETTDNALGDMSLRIYNLTIEDGLKISLQIFFLLITVLILPGMINRDKQDKSIYFWRSLPVSETRNVLTKLLVAAVILPIVYFIISLLAATLGLGLGKIFQWLFLSEVGHNAITLDILFYAYRTIFIVMLSTFLLIILALPVLGWMMLCSAYFSINRYVIPLMLAPFFAIVGVEDLIFNSSYIGEIFYVYIMSALKATYILQTQWVLPYDLYQLEPAVLLGVALIAASIYVKRWKVD